MSRSCNKRGFNGDWVKREGNEVQERLPKDFSRTPLYFDQVPEIMGGVGYLHTLNSLAGLRQTRGESPSFP